MGFGGGSNKAADEANRAEQERQSSIQRTQSAINAVFDGAGRESEIQDFIDATRDFYTQDLNRQKADTDRQLRFALARGGLTGGSTQIDQQRRFADDYARGLLQVEQKAQGAGTNVRAADQDARARLITLATSGLDATTGAQQAAASMRNSIDANRANDYAGGLSNAFSGLQGFIDKSRESAERRRANIDSGFSWYGRPAGSGHGGWGG